MAGLLSASPKTATANTGSTGVGLLSKSATPPIEPPEASTPAAPATSLPAPENNEPIDWNAVNVKPEYFQGEEPSGAFVGVSDESDPYSGRPYLAYKLPGQATTTDPTRVASKMNPEIATAIARSAFTNERMPESASEALRTVLDAQPDQQLDHRMALSVGGSNSGKNLAMIPTQANQAAGKEEGQLSQQVADGLISLFQAQNEEAKQKGLPAPWTDQQIQKVGQINWAALPTPVVSSKLPEGHTFSENPIADTNSGLLPPVGTIAKDTGKFYSDYMHSAFNDAIHPGAQETTPADATPGGLTANTLLGLPKATLQVGGSILQGMFRIAAALPLTLNAASNVKTGTDAPITLDPTDVPDSEKPVFNALFGDQPIHDMATDIAASELAIKENPLAQQLGIDKASIPLPNGKKVGIPLLASFAGVMGNDVLSYAPFGGEENALSALAKTSDVGEVSNILRQIGVQEDLIPQVAPKIASMTDPQEVKQGLDLVNTLQKTTRMADSINSNEAAGSKASGLSIEKTPGAPQSAEEAAARYHDEKLAATPTDKPIVIGGDDMKDHFGGDYAPQKSNMYSKASYQLAQHAIEEYPDRNLSIVGGGPGSGKTEMVVKTLADNGDKGIIYDSSLSDAKGVGNLIDLARSKGKSVHIYNVLPDVETARAFTLAREGQTGRGVEDATFANRHAQNPRALQQLLESGKVSPEEVTLLDTRDPENPVIHDDPLAVLKNVAYNEDTLKNQYAKENFTPERVRRSTAAAVENKGRIPEALQQSAETEGEAEDRETADELGLPRGTTVGEGTQAKAEEFTTGRKNIIDRISVRSAEDQGHATQEERQQPTGKGTQEGNTSRSSQGPSFPQETIHKIKLQVKGSGYEPRVKSAIGLSERIATQIVNKGQEAYVSGLGLSDKDLLTIRDGFQAGNTIEDIAKETSDPGKAENFMRNVEDYYDFELAADRAAGGDTGRYPNYLPQRWDLSDPKDLERFNDLAEQKGLKPYYGYSSFPKVFSSYAEGEANGFKPLNENILEDLGQHYSSASRVISRQALAQGLKEAAPDMVSMSGYGLTKEGKPYVNLNTPGLEGLSVHPSIAKMLKGFDPLKSPDFIKLVQKSGAEAALDKTGLSALIAKTVAGAKSIPANAKEAGFSGVLGSLWDHATGPMKQVLWNWSGFHSLNITLSHMGASSLHPITGAKGVLQSVGAAVSERVYDSVINGYKEMMVTDSEGNTKSVFDWAVESGAYEPRELPAQGLSKVNPFKVGQSLIFDREIPVLQLNLAEQAAKKGIPADSPQGLALGEEIRTITGEINTKTMNLNPNTVRAASRAMLSPGFTYSKYKTLLDAFTRWGQEHGAAGNLARTAVIGKSAIIGTAATIGTLLATGKFPNLQQLLMNFTLDPRLQTNMTNTKGQKLDITFPKTFLSEGASAILNPVAYGNARLNPLIADMLKVYSNQDYYGNPIVDPNVNTSRALQLAENLGVGHLPIGAQAVVNSLRGKQSAAQGAIQVAGLGTKVSASDPTMVQYANLDQAKAAVEALAPDDPARKQKMQDIVNGLPADQRASLTYQLMLDGISTKGVYTSATEQKYYEIQDLLAKGDTAGAAAITQAMTPAEYSTYKSIKTRQTNEALFEKVQSLLTAGQSDQATHLTASMSPSQYKSYESWKTQQGL